MTHICVIKLTIIGSDNDFSGLIIWTNAVILLNETLGTNFHEILYFHSRKCFWKCLEYSGHFVSSAMVDVLRLVVNFPTVKKFAFLHISTDRYAVFHGLWHMIRIGEWSGTDIYFVSGVWYFDKIHFHGHLAYLKGANNHMIDWLIDILFPRNVQTYTLAAHTKNFKKFHVHPNMYVPLGGRQRNYSENQRTL